MRTNAKLSKFSYLRNFDKAFVTQNIKSRNSMLLNRITFFFENVQYLNGHNKDSKISEKGYLFWLVAFCEEIFNEINLITFDYAIVRTIRHIFRQRYLKRELLLVFGFLARDCKSKVYVCLSFWNVSIWVSITSQIHRIQMRHSSLSTPGGRTDFSPGS